MKRIFIIFLFIVVNCTGVSSMQAATECLFCKIATGQIKSFSFWQDTKHIAFLSIYPNTPGVTVVIPKQHYPSYAFDLPDTVLSELVVASKKVAKIIDESFPDVGRTAFVFEGFGIDHVHAKLFPMHQTKAYVNNWQPINSNISTYFSKYLGYISTHDYKGVPEEELKNIHDILINHPQAVRSENEK